MLGLYLVISGVARNFIWGGLVCLPFRPSPPLPLPSLLLSLALSLLSLSLEVGPLKSS